MLGVCGAPPSRPTKLQHAPGWSLGHEREDDLQGGQSRRRDRRRGHAACERLETVGGDGIDFDVGHLRPTPSTTKDSTASDDSSGKVIVALKDALVAKGMGDHHLVHAATTRSGILALGSVRRD